MTDQRIVNQIKRHPEHEEEILSASALLDKQVKITNHTDEQGDHLAIGTTGQIIDFCEEHFDGLRIKLGDQIDLVFPEELEIIV